MRSIFSMFIRSLVMIGALLTFAGCPQSFVSGTQNSGPSAPPIAIPQTLNVNYNTPLALTLSGTSSSGGLLSSATYTIVAGPAHGVLSGSAPSLTYTPSSSYAGSDSFTFKVNDGTFDSISLATVTLTLAAPVLFLRSSGNDGTAIAGDVTHPYLTAQAVVNKAIALSPSAAFPVVIDVGSLNAGNFGDVTLSQDFGQYVTWRGVDTSHSIIGDITASGLPGADGVDDGNVTPAGGANGANGFSIWINADNKVMFHNLTSSGGGGGAAVNNDGSVSSGNGGNGGQITIGNQVALTGSIVVDGGGFGNDPSGYFFGGGGSAGAVYIGTGVNLHGGSVSAVGGSAEAYSCASSIPCDGGGGGGGTIMVGAGSTVMNIHVDGGNSGTAVGGGAGSVTFNGTALGAITAGGGASGDYVNNNSTGVSGGSIQIGTPLINATVHDLYASGGYAAWGPGSGGNITVYGTVLGDINAHGGQGNGGNISVTTSSALNIITATSDFSYGGSITINAPSSLPSIGGFSVSANFGDGTITFNGDITLTQSINADWTINGTATFNGGDNEGTVNGDAIFNNGATNGASGGGSVVGTATFYAPSSAGGNYGSCTGNGC